MWEASSSAELNCFPQSPEGSIQLHVCFEAEVAAAAAKSCWYVGIVEAALEVGIMAA